MSGEHSQNLYPFSSPKHLFQYVVEFHARTINEVKFKYLKLAS
jgi:hypothetical protein